MKTQQSILALTKIRDQVIFFSYALLITLLFQLNTYQVMRWDITRISLCALMLGQFYLTAYLKIPIRSAIWKKIILGLFHIINFFVFREVILAFTPRYILSTPYFEGMLVVFFLLVVIGRDIRLYSGLSDQLHRLEKWSEKKILFEKPEKLKVHLGEPGQQMLHPNEIVYIRTKNSGDHTKIFGIKSAENGSFKEYETTAYANFNEIGRLLSSFPQFKRISQSTVINFKYPYEEKNGVVSLEGRRFSISKKFK